MASIVPAPVLDLRNGDLVAAEAIGALPSELSDRSNSNPAVVVLEAGGFEMDRLLYQINRWPSAVIQKVLNLCGVTLNPAVPATAQQTFTLSQPQANDTVVKAGTNVSTADGTTVFSTIADCTISGYNSTAPQPTGTVSTTAGSTTVTGSGTNFQTGLSWVGYQIQIPASTGTWYTIASVTNSTTLTLTNTALATTAGAAWFVGAVSNTTSVQANTAGSATNVGAATLTTLQGAAAGVASTTNAAAATGGSDIETVTAAIARAATAFAARDMAVTAPDYAYFAQQILGAGGRAIAKANTNVNTPANGYVSIALLSPNWTAATPVTSGERGAVVKDLSQRTFPGATTIDLPATIYQPQSALGVCCAVFRKSAFAAVSCQVAVSAALNTYLSPSTYPFGRVIYMPDLIRVIENVQSVDRVHEINGVPAVGTNYQATPATLSVTNGSASVTTASTTGMIAGQTFIIDASNNAIYLVTAIAGGPTLTLDRVWAGTTNAALATNFFNSADDDMNGGTNNPLWYSVPYSNLSVSTSSPPAQVVVVGSV